MKKIMNITTSSFDADRYKDHADLRNSYKELGLDGLEVLQVGEAENCIIQPDDVIGIHSKYFTSWVDFWKGDEKRFLREFDNWDNIQKIYGGTTKESIIEIYKNNFRFAANFSPEYMVFHVADCTVTEFIKKSFMYTDEDIVDATIDLVNHITDYIEGNPLLLFENLWYCGMTMEKPELVYKLLDGINYKNKGIMLDIGHLLNTNINLRTLDEGIDYILEVLERYKDLSIIKGIHLHQSLSGEYSEYFRKTWQGEDLSYELRYKSVLEHIFKIDTHQPFTHKDINKFIEIISPEYLVLEQISSTREEHESNLKKQLEYL